MVGHKHPTLHLYFESFSAIAEPMRIRGNVGVTGEQGLSVVTPLNDVDRNFDRAKSMPSGQAILQESRRSPEAAPEQLPKEWQFSPNSCQPTLAPDSDPAGHSAIMRRQRMAALAEPR